MNKTIIITIIINLIMPFTLFAADIDPSTLSYLGAFKIGSGVYQPGHGLSFNAAGNSGAGSLFVIKENYATGSTDYVFEITIPTPVVGALGSLNTATVLHQGDITGGKLGTLKSGISEYYYMGDVQPYNGKLHWNVYIYYDVNWESDDDINHYVSQGWSDLTNWWTTPNAAGTWKIADNAVNPDGRYHGDFLTLADTAFADSYFGSKYLLEGRRRENGTYGPGLYAIAPWSDGNPPADGYSLTRTPLLRYGPSHPISDDAPNDTYRDAAWIFIGGKRALLFVGTKGTAANNCYGGAECNDPCSSTHGYHSYPYTLKFYWYSVDDLAEVYAGTKDPWEPVPYSTNTPTIFYDQDQCPSELGGVVFDASTNRLYVSEVGVDSDDSVIHVFQFLTHSVSISSGPHTFTTGAGPHILTVE